MKLKSLAFGYEARSISRVKDVIGIGVFFVDNFKSCVVSSSGISKRGQMEKREVKPFHEECQSVFVFRGGGAFMYFSGFFNEK